MKNFKRENYKFLLKFGEYAKNWHKISFVFKLTLCMYWDFILIFVEYYFCECIKIVVKNFCYFWVLYLVFHFPSKFQKTCLGVLCGLGDFIAQTAIDKKHLQEVEWTRVGRFAFIGAVLIVSQFLYNSWS